MTETILLVEDEKNIVSFVRPELEHEGYAITVAENGRDAVALFEDLLKMNTPPGIVLLDIMLPELNGLEVLRRIRKLSTVPVIMLTARGETFDKVSGLDAGADDYITKPFAIEELLARMRSVLRRKQPQAEASTIQQTGHEENVLYFAELRLDLSRVEVTMQDKIIQLTKTEFSLLHFLMQHPGEVLSRDRIIQAVWGEEHYIDENSVDVYIRYLRSKIDDAFGVQYIKTVRGSGYTLKENAV